MKKCLVARNDVIISGSKLAASYDCSERSFIIKTEKLFKQWRVDKLLAEMTWRLEESQLVGVERAETKADEAPRTAGEIRV